MGKLSDYGGVGADGCGNRDDDHGPAGSINSKRERVQLAGSRGALMRPADDWPTR